MRFSTLFSLSILAALIWGTYLRADDAPPGGSWLGRWFSLGKQTSKKEFEDVHPVSEPAVNQRSLAESAYHRRMEVCLKLEIIANQTKDQALLVEVELLKQQVWQHYLKVTTGNIPQ